MDAFAELLCSSDDEVKLKRSRRGKGGVSLSAPAVESGSDGIIELHSSDGSHEGCALPASKDKTTVNLVQAVLFSRVDEIL